MVSMPPEMIECPICREYVAKEDYSVIEGMCNACSEEWADEVFDFERDTENCIQESEG